MPIIFDETVKNLSPLAKQYGSIMKEIAESAKVIRERCLQDGTIVTVPVLDNTEMGTVSLCAIDGASGSEKMQSADLLIAGATLHEGVNSKQIFGQHDNDDKPYASYSDIRIHTAKNDQILSSMRAFTEIAVLGEAEHNIVIIDGAYLGNFLTVLYQLQDSKYSAEKLIEYLKNDEQGSFMKGVRKILDVNYQERSGQSIIALAKSDSSREMVKRYNLSKSEFFATDKMLAEYMLNPGEMLLPASVRANTGRVSLLELNASTGYWNGFKWDPVKDLNKIDFKILADFFNGTSEILDGSNYPLRDKDLFSLYTYLYELDAYHYTYFKPHKFRQGSNPLRIEFAGATTGVGVNRNEKAMTLASHVDSDIINPTFKEPYSQYMVDRDVKTPVSSALKYFKAKLGQEVQNMGIHIDGVTSGYRT